MVAAIVPLFFLGGANLEAGEVFNLKTALYVYRNGDFRTVSIPGAAETGETHAVVIRSPATLRFDEVKLSLDGSRFAWSGGRNPPDRFSLIAAPAVQLVAGRPASLLFSTPVQYLEKLPDGTLTAREIAGDSPEAPHCRLTFTMEPVIDPRQDLRLVCDLGIARMSAREKVPGVTLDVGKPVLARLREKLDLQVRADTWSALLMQAPNGSDYSMLALFKVVSAKAPHAVAGAEPADRVLTRAELGHFVNTYYRHPRPEFIPAAVEALGPSRFLQRRFWMTVGFFAEVFAENPDRMAQWRKLATWKDWETRDCLKAALQLSRPGAILALKGPWYVRREGIFSFGNSWGSVNSLWWGAFLASGNPAYLRRLIAQLRHIDDPPNGLSGAGVGAMMMLSHNAPDHPLVRVTLEAARKDADPRTRELIGDLLAKDPAAIRKEIHDIRGNWPDAVSINGMPGGGIRDVYSPVGPP